jgi:hypothetical protein
MERTHFLHFAPEFADIEHLQPALAVVEPYVNRPDGSVLQLEYREGECIPYAVARYHLPADAALNGAIVGGSGAKQCGPCCAGFGLPCWCECHLDAKGGA